jgi:type I restriction enzyme, S subunit
MSKERKLIPVLRFPEFMIDGEWDVKELSKLGELINGLTYSPDDVRDKGLLVLRSSNIQNGLIDLKDCVFVREDINGANLSMPSDILICVRNGSKNLIGKNAIIPKGFPLATHGAFMSVLRASNPEFIFQLFQTDYYNTQVKADLGATINSINGKNFLKYEFPIPENSQEQQKIASCLSSLDEVIASHSQKLALLKDHKKGLMQNLFPQESETHPKYRFPNYKSSLNKVGFADLGDIKIGLTHKPDYINSGVPFLSSKNISGGFIDFENVQYISQEKFQSMPESTKPKLGDILFTRVGSNLGNPIILDREIEFGIFVSLGAFRVNKKAHSYYMKYWMESDLFWKQVNQKVAGGAKDNLNSTWLKEFELFIPTIEEQQKIASCLSSLDALITDQAEKIEQLKLHKKGLMQGLFPKIND